jgi:hypothetical protein
VPLGLGIDKLDVPLSESQRDGAEALVSYVWLDVPSKQRRVGEHELEFTGHSAAWVSV